MLLHQKFIESAKKFGSKMFVIDRTTGRNLTYSRGLIASMILAEKFKQYEPGFIGILLPTSGGGALSMLGALMSGRVPVYINYSTGAAQNCEYAQQKCDFKTIITSKALLEKIKCPVVDGMVFVEDILESVTSFEKIRAALKTKLPASMLTAKYAQGDEHDTAFILFTSGSEKDPKGVQLTHHNIIANIQSLEKVFTFGPDDTFLAQLPYFHIFGQTGNLWAPIYFGMTIVSYANPLDFKTISDIVREEKCTLMVGTPAFFWGYLQKSEPGDFKTVRIMLTGADKCPDALRKGFLEKHNVTLLEAYGATETSPGITVNTHKNNRPGSVGRPLPGVQVRVENYETGEMCKTGDIGKILTKGDNVMKGYFDDFEQTSLAIRHGWYDTGDMGWMDEDGYLWHVGRLKRFLKIAGEMVSLVKVEDVLEKLLPDGASCCVVEVPDHLRGAKIVAAVTHPIEEKEVLRKMSEKLPNIALPKQFVQIEELPKMGSGKIDFRKVTDLVREIVQAKR
ncbi:MAG: AMP-binding protein [Bacteroidetes bacterium]|jgi:acyl-[acyl-carrier-protein]-phospholipid O-acyltransferase/long-chain-fatty-acid--[acyl-carrier-protein] ligase|nr:AMP-binding protein [Bacteroidota bacterium]